MSLSVVVVGINQWQEFTRPAVESILMHEPSARVVVVDNASDPRYPDDYSGVRIAERVCYAAAINAGVEAARDPDWTLVLNNDVLCLGRFSEMVHSLNPGVLYGAQIIRFGGMTWLGGWLYCISRACREAVGPWDEQFEICGFEDCDYSLRAAAAGYPTQIVRLPFHHFWGKTRWGIPTYAEVRLENIARLEKKHSVSLAGEWAVEE